MRHKLGALLLALGVLLLLAALFRMGSYASPAANTAFNAESQQELLTGKTSGKGKTAKIAAAGLAIVLLGGALAGKRGLAYLGGDRQA